MKRFLGIALVSLAILLTTFVVTVNLLASRPLEQPPNLELPIPLADGSVLTVRELLEAEPLEAAPDRGPAPSHAKAGSSRRLFDIGMDQLARGDTERALAVWQAVPSNHPDYARAQRFIGWKIYDRELSRPGEGVSYVNRSLAADPLSGNGWQDAVRIYWNALGEGFR